MQGSFFSTILLPFFYSTNHLSCVCVSCIRVCCWLKIWLLHPSEHYSRCLSHIMSTPLLSYNFPPCYTWRKSGYSHSDFKCNVLLWDVLYVMFHLYIHVHTANTAEEYIFCCCHFRVVGNKEREVDDGVNDGNLQGNEALGVDAVWTHCAVWNGPPAWMMVTA